MRDAHPVIIAHRGASGYLPEHSLAAKALAHAQGADFLEQDVVLSRDLVPVVLHDIQIDTVADVAERFPDRRRGDGRFYAFDLTLAELRTLTIHERTDPTTGLAVFPNRFPAGVGAGRIPTLAEELDFIAGLNRSTGSAVGIYPEIKQPAWHRAQGVEITPIVIDVIDRHWRPGLGPCFVQCFDFAELKHLGQVRGTGWPLIYLIEGLDPGPGAPDLRTPEGWTAAAQVVDGIGPSLALVLAAGLDGLGNARLTDLAATAHGAGLLVHPWTVRADALPAGIDRVDGLLATLFGARGVDGVFIDQPDLGVAAVRSHRPR